SSPAQFANELRIAVGKDYGHAGPLQVQAILSYSIECLREEHQKILALFAAANPQQRRVAETFAAVALAGEIAARNGIVPWDVATTEDFSESDSANAAVTLFNCWKQNWDSPANFSSEHSQMLSAIRDFIERFTDGQFSDLHATASVT